MDVETTMKKPNNLYIAWVPFQRRAQSLGTSFDLDVRYYHFNWAENGKVSRLFSWFGKSIATFLDLLKYKPEYVFIQLAPTPLLYITALYCSVTRCCYISDCHNTMLYDAHNIHWPFAKLLLRRSHLLLVHNEDVKEHADKFDIPSVILRDPLPEMAVPNNIAEVGGIRLSEETYIIVPCSMAEDEPLDELFSAIEMVPEVLFVVTWFHNRLPDDLRSRAPENLRFTGFLEEPDFNALYAKANAAVVLTTREGTQPSGASEAISLGIPLVVSDIRTTRRLYKDKPVFTNNDAASIASSVKIALSDYDKWSNRISDLKSDLESAARSQIDTIKSNLPH